MRNVLLAKNTLKNPVKKISPEMSFLRNFVLQVMAYKAPIHWKKEGC
jgi:hypothetical protein